MASLVQWWQHLPSHIDPTIFWIGKFPVKWYGLMYILAFAVLYLLCVRRLKPEKLPWTKSFVGDLVTWCIVGTLIGGRLGSIVFYDTFRLFRDPLRVLSPIMRVQGHWVLTGVSGMSYHGGVIGIIVAVWWFGRRRRENFLTLLDFIVPVAVLAYTFGRLGNFLNGELYGRVTNSAIGMYFPAAGDGLLRHPSQLYEALFEGPVLFAVLWALRKRSPYPGFLFGIYLFGYGFARFLIEFFREPDAPWGFVLWKFSMGQVLCAAQMVAAVIWLRLASRAAARAAAAPVAAAARRKARA